MTSSLYRSRSQQPGGDCQGPVLRGRPESPPGALASLTSDTALYRFKTHRMVFELGIHEISRAAWEYSLITPPSTFRR